MNCFCNGGEARLSPNFTLTQMTSIRILHLEDDPLDAALIRGRLDAGGYGDHIEVVQGEIGFRQALSADTCQLILADYRLPGFDGLTALTIAQEVRPETPFIFVSGEMGEELAISSLKAGAADYVLKDNLNRLVPAVENALAKAEERQARAKAEDAVRDLVRQWQNTFDAVSDAIFIVGENHHILRCNKAFLALAGAAGEQELLGRPCWEVVHGAGAPIDSCPFAVTLQHGRRASSEIPLRDKWVELVTYPLELDTPNQRRGAVHLIRDITERKEAEGLLLKQEQKFRSLIENSPDMIARYDRDCRFVYMNRRLATFLGSAPQALLAMTLGEACPDGRFDACQDKMLEAMQSRQDTEIEIDYEDDRVLLIRFTPEFDDSGQVTGVLTFASDITAIKQTQLIMKGQAQAMASTNTALKVMLNHSRQAETALQENFLASIEGLILPYLDQLDRLSNSDEALAYLRLIRNNIKNLVTTFAKDLSAPILGLTPREVQIADLIRQGKSSKEIAHLLRLSKGTVECYRDQIRKKMDVKNKKINLRSYLLSYFSE